VISASSAALNCAREADLRGACTADLVALEAQITNAERRLAAAGSCRRSAPRKPGRHA
jgi:uncharacterized membrane protein